MTEPTQRTPMPAHIRKAWTATEPDRCECKTPAPRRIWGGSLECQRCRRYIPATTQLRLAIR